MSFVLKTSHYFFKLVLFLLATSKKCMSFMEMVIGILHSIELNTTILVLHVDHEGVIPVQNS